MTWTKTKPPTSNSTNVEMENKDMNSTTTSNKILATERRKSPPKKIRMNRKKEAKVLRAQHETLDFTTEVYNELMWSKNRRRDFACESKCIGSVFFSPSFLLYWPFISDTVRTLTVQRMACMVRDKFSSHTSNHQFKVGESRRCEWWRCWALVPSFRRTMRPLSIYTPFDCAMNYYVYVQKKWANAMPASKCEL